jgi:hypothetical protein
MTCYRLSLDQPDGEIGQYSNLLKVWRYLKAWADEREIIFYGYPNFANKMQGQQSLLFRVGDTHPMFKVERVQVQ